MSDYSALHVAAMFRSRQAKARYKDKKVVKDSDGDDMTVYEYSEQQIARRNSDKAKRVQKLRELRSGLIKRVRKDLKSSQLKTRLTALAVALLDHTYERVGNEGSAKEGHFGVTGWQVKHLSFSGNKAKITYIGKSGVKQSKEVKDPTAVALLKELTKGKKGTDSIFTCEDSDGSEVCITAKEVNAYLPEGITAKDLRGLHANQEMLKCLKAIRGRGGKLPSEAKERTKLLKEEFKTALAEAASTVGHEPGTLKSQYLVPKLENAYLKDGTILNSLDGKTAKVQILRPTGKETWQGGSVYQMRVGNDTFVHFTTLSRALQIVKSGKLLMRPPYAKMGIDAVNAVSLVYGGYVPTVQTTHIKEHKDPLMAVVFQTNVPPEEGYIEEVVWKRDVPLRNPKILAASKAIAMLRRTPEQITGDDSVVYKTATKSNFEKEEEEERRLLRRDPKKKPPRYDLRRQRIKEEDEDTERPGADNDKDLSRNYKRVASLYLAAQVAKSEEAAKKLFEQYQQKNPETEKTWKDFYEEPEKKGLPEKEEPKPSSGKKDDAPKTKPSKKDDAKGEKDPGLEERAKEVAHKKLVKETLGKVKETLSGLEGVSLPTQVRNQMTTALEGMTPEQVEAFSASLADHTGRVKGMAMDGPGAVKNAERALEDLQSYDFSATLDPTELARKIVEKSHAEAIVGRQKAKQKGKARAVSDSIDAVESHLQTLVDEGYRLPKAVRDVLKEQMERVDEKALGDFVTSVTTALDDLNKGDLDSTEALEEARDVMADAVDNIDEMDNTDAKGAAIAEMIHAQRILDRSDQREQAKSKAIKKAVSAVARVFGEKTLPSTVKKGIEEALAKLPADQLPDFVEAVQARHALVREQIKPDPETGDQRFPPGLITEAADALRSESYEGSAAEIGEQVAMAMAAQSLIADPFDLGGEKIGARDLDHKSTIARGRLAYDKYKDMPQEMRIAAARKITERLEKVDPESSEAAELNRVLDGITLAALTGERSEKGGIPQIPGREVNEGFAEMARAMAKDGKVDLLLGPVEDFYSAEGQQEVHRAMQSMSDEALAKSVESIMPNAVEFLVGKTETDEVSGERVTKPTLSEHKKAILRNALIDISIDQMSVMDRVLRSRLQETGDERFDDPDYRAEKMSKVKQDFDSGWWERLLAKWLKPEGPDSTLISGVPTSGVSGKAASLLSGWKLVYSVEKLPPPDVGMRLELLEALNKAVGREVGKPSDSHADRALSRFLETKNPQFLRSNPETPDETPSEALSDEFEAVEGKKEGRSSRFSLDTDRVVVAGQPSVSAPSHLSPHWKGSQMTKPLTKEAAQTAKKITDLLDHVGNIIQANSGLLEVVGIPSKISHDFAYRGDLLSDHIDRMFQAADPELKLAYTQGTGEGTTPGKDDNTNAGPPQPFNPKEIGGQDATPPKTEPDESYMKKNFIQEEFNELRHYQQDGLFSNARAASESVSRMIAKLQGLQVALDVAAAG